MKSLIIFAVLAIGCDCPTEEEILKRTLLNCEKQSNEILNKMQISHGGISCAKNRYDYEDFPVYGGYLCSTLSENKIINISCDYDASSCFLINDDLIKNRIKINNK